MIDTPTASSPYIPGACNINRAEVAKRRRAGYTGSVLFLVMLAVLIALGLPSLTRLFLVIPGFLAVIGFVQANSQFCVGFAAAGIHSTIAEGLDTTSVSNATDHAADKKRALQLNLLTAALSVALTLLSLALPPYRF